MVVRILCVFFLLGLWQPVLCGDGSLQKGSFKASLEGVELAYLVAGQGPPMVVMPNSWGIEKESLQALFSPLESHFTMIYFDARGMGGSSAVDDVALYGIATLRHDFDSLRRYLKLDKTYLLGWSAGAMNGFLHAAEYGDHLLGAVLVHGGAYTDPASEAEMVKVHAAFFQRLGAKMTELMQSTGPESSKNEEIKRFLLDDWLPYICADREAGKALVHEKLEAGNYSWPRMSYMMTDLATFDARSARSKITCPVLVLGGEKDIIAPHLLKSDAEAMVKGSYVNFPASGHFAMLEETDAFVSSILNWRAQFAK